MNHYVYNIIHKWTCMRYIGVRSCPCDPRLDLGFGGYISSSTDKEFKEEQRLYPKRFVYEILGIFNTREEAAAYEMELHLRYDVANNMDFYNMSRVTSSYFSCGIGENHPRYGKIHTEVTKKLMKANHQDYRGKNHPKYGMKLSQETKDKICKGNLGRHHTMEARDKIRKARIGTKRSKETLQKMSKTAVGLHIERIEKEVLYVKELIDLGLSMSKACNQSKISRPTYRKYKDEFE